MNDTQQNSNVTTLTPEYFCTEGTVWIRDMIFFTSSNVEIHEHLHITPDNT
jgi:hypothetical protein